MSETVMADAQFGTVKILKPFNNFEGVYNTTPARRPIQFTEGGVAIDPQAGKPGYDPRLLKGIACPLGARITIWLPAAIHGGAGDVALPYEWEFTWRYRNVFDFRQNRVPFHYPKQSPGVPDGPSPRVIIPAATHAVVFNQAEPAGTVDGVVTNHLRPEDISAMTRGYGTPNGTELPFLPDGSEGHFQQGLFDPAVSIAFQPTYAVFELQAAGDELLIGAHRDGTPVNWELTFGGFDAAFLLLFNNQLAPDVGVYISMGSAP